MGRGGSAFTTPAFGALARPRAASFRGRSAGWRPKRRTYAQLLAVTAVFGLAACTPQPAETQGTPAALPAGVQAQRFEVVVNLLAMEPPQRLRVRVQVPESDPTVPTCFELWPGTEAMEREVWDMFGIAFEGHPDLRRILTDYGFVGHPFRKDFPVSGYVEMRYDPEQRRVIYQPVTIEPREIVPRVIREDWYGQGR